MKITWLGQAGLLFEEEGVSLMIDPYLSDCVAKLNPAKARRVPVDERFFDITPDVLIFTHDHLDHYDPETAPRFLGKTDKEIVVLCPPSVFPKALAHENEHNYVRMERGTVWTEGPFRITAVKAAHSDPDAMGVLIEVAGKTYYVTGDTLYNENIFADIPAGVELLLLPVNGVGNNMNMQDAARFAARVAPRFAVPLHVGLFDSLDPRDFPYENKIIPQFFREIEVPS